MPHSPRLATARRGCSPRLVAARRGTPRIAAAHLVSPRLAVARRARRSPPRLVAARRGLPHSPRLATARRGCSPRLAAARRGPPLIAAARRPGCSPRLAAARHGPLLIDARLRFDLARRERDDLKARRTLTNQQFKQRVSHLLLLYSIPREGERWNYYQRLLRSMPARLAKCRANRFGPCGQLCSKVLVPSRGIYCMSVSQMFWFHFLNVTVCVNEELKV